MDPKAILQRWTILFALVYLFASAISPLYAGVFLFLASILGAVSMYRYELKGKIWFRAFATFYFVMFLLLPCSDNIFVSLRHFIVYLKYWLIFLLPVYFVTASRRRDIIPVMSGVLLAVQGLIAAQLLGHPVLPVLQMAGAAEKMIFAGQFVTVFPFLLVGISQEKNRLLLASYWCNLMMGVLLLQYCGCRASLAVLLALTVMFLLVFVRKQAAVFSAQPAALLLGLTVMALLIVPAAKGADMERYYHYLVEQYRGEQVWQFLGQYWLTGVGLGGVSDYADNLDQAMGNFISSYVNIAAETGVSGLVSFAVMFGLLLHGQYRQCGKTEDISWYVVAVLMIAGFLLQSAVFHYFAIPGVMHWFFLLLGMCYISSAGARESET